MLTAASCFHGQKVVFDDTTQMLRLLEPLAGSLSVGLFAFGVVAAGLSSQFPNVLLFPWLYCDYRGIPFRLSAPFFRWIVAFISLLGLTVPLFGGRPILVMVTSQAFGALLLPASVVCILYLGNRRSLMGKNVLRWPDNLFLVVTLVFALIMALIGFRGIVAIIGTWIS